MTEALIFLSSIGGICAVGIGALWYSPRVFGALWMHSVHMTPEDIEHSKKKMPVLVCAGFASATVLSCVLAYLMGALGVATLYETVALAIVLWLGFMVPVVLAPVLWEHKPLSYAAINGGYWLVTVVTIGVVMFVLALA